MQTGIEFFLDNQKHKGRLNLLILQLFPDGNHLVNHGKEWAAVIEYPTEILPIGSDQNYNYKEIRQHSKLKYLKKHPN